MTTYNLYVERTFRRLCCLHKRRTTKNQRAAYAYNFEVFSVVLMVMYSKIPTIEQGEMKNKIARGVSKAITPFDSFLCCANDSSITS
jgi:hypothetical protein